MDVCRRAIAVALSAAVLTGCGGADAPRPTGVKIRGVPQKNFTLGDERAPAILTIYADPMCAGPACDALTPEAVLAVARRQVAAGRLRLVLRPVPTPDAPERGIREAFAASLQDHLWDFMLTAWRNPDITDPMAIARATPGLDVGRLEHDAKTERVAEAVARAELRARRRDALVPSVYFDPPGRGPVDAEAVPLLIYGDLRDIVDARVDVG